MALLGFFLGVICTILWGEAIKGTTLAFLFNWQLFLFTGSIVTVICIFTIFLSMKKIYSIDPILLMGS
jgi:putative ABC transport system permease protein